MLLIAGCVLGWQWRKREIIKHELTEYARILQRAYEASATSAPEGVPCTDAPTAFQDRFGISWNGTHRSLVKFERIRLGQATLEHLDGSTEQILQLYPDASDGVIYIFGFPIPTYYTGHYFGFRKVDGRWCFDEASFSVVD